jgi:NADH dehydrogenase
MKVFLTGATGFVGTHLLQALTTRGHELTCLVRRKGRLKPPVREVLGDATSPEGLAEATAGMDAVIHLVGIIREFPEKGVTFQRLHVEATGNVVNAAIKAGVKRYLHMSANGSRPHAPSPYHRTKWAAEELVRRSGLAWTIFRPSIIFGPGDGFVTLLADMIRRAPLVPVIGDGRYLLQPVSVTTVAEGFALALEKGEMENKEMEKGETVGRSFEVGGPNRLTYDRVLDLVAEALGRRRPAKLHLPVCPVELAAGLLGRFAWFPVTTDQITMLLAGNTCDERPFYDAFGLTPLPFAASLDYLRRS